MGGRGERGARKERAGSRIVKGQELAENWEMMKGGEGGSAGSILAAHEREWERESEKEGRDRKIFGGGGLGKRRYDGKTALDRLRKKKSRGGIPRV